MAERLKIPLLTWSAVKNIVASNKLELLGRSDAQHAVYQCFQETVAKNWESIRDYILVNKFNFDSMVGEFGKKRAVERDIVGVVDYLGPNDFPYHFEEGIDHYIYWKLGGPVIEEDLTKIAQDMIKSNAKAKDYVVYLNPVHLKSIPDLEHGHILICLNEP